MSTIRTMPAATLMRHFSPLRASILAVSTVLRGPTQAVLPRVDLGSPALYVMTDFNSVRSVTIDPRASFDEANRIMLDNGVRLLLVVGTGGLVSGVITASDILGEKTLRAVQQRDLKRTEIEVRHIMTPNEGLETIEMREVLNAKVGHVVATLKRVHRQHALVVEPAADGGSYVVRGLFSASRIARQLGVRAHVGDVARTFAEIEVLLNHTSAAKRRNWRVDPAAAQAFGHRAAL